MVLFCLTILTLAFLTLVGRAGFALAGYNARILRAWLLSPAMGLAIVLFPVMVLNQAGLPIAAFAWPLTAALLLAAIAVLWRLRPALPTAKLIPFWLIVIVHVAWVAWPAARFGLDWISFANDDMANYCLAAERFASHGFFQVPSGIELNRRDYAQTYWYMHVSDLMRFGSEHLLAWMRSLTGEPATRLFMTVIVALAGVQMLATAGLVLHLGRHRRWALVTILLLAISPLFLLGSLYQLIAQVGGMGLLLTMIALLTETRPAGTLKGRFRQSVAPALIGAMLCTTYPEVTPFAVVVFLPYLGILALRERERARRLLAMACLTLAGIIVLLHHNLFSYIYTFSKQFESATRVTDLSLSLFPFFMIPTGFSNLFGWMPIGHDFAEPFLSLSVLSGMGFMIAALGMGAMGCARGYPIALLLTVQLALALKLFSGGNDFGLYKLAMFLQPALFAGMAALVLRVRPGSRMPWILAGLYFITTAPTSVHYTVASCGLRAGGLTELRHASRLGLSIDEPAKPQSQIISSVDNVVAAKFAASELRGHDLIFTSRDFFQPIIHINYRHYQPLLKFHPYFETLKKTPALEDLHSQRFVRLTHLWQTEFTVNHQLQPPELYLSMAPELSLFNKFPYPDSNDPGYVFKLQPVEQLRNYLVFVHSGRGNHYYLGDRRRIALFQQEADPYNPGSTFIAMGRFILMRVENPDKEFYLRLSATRSALKPRVPWSSRARILGQQDYSLAVEGDGAFNRYIGPIRPHWHEGAAYIAIDFSEIPRPVADQRSGLKALYHTSIPLDPRRIVGWGRDISIVGVDEYRRLHRPGSVLQFPKDLATAHGLEYAGAYEDSWLCPNSDWRLAGAPEGGYVRVRINTPEVEGTSLGQGHALVTINQARPLQLRAANGVSDWLFPVGAAQPTTRIEMRFSHSAALPGDDQRIISTLLERIEVLDKIAPRWDYTSADKPRLASPGVDPDGWMQQKTALMVPSLPSGGRIRLRMEIPEWAKIAGTQITSKMGDAAPHRSELPPGLHDLEIPATADAEPRLLQIEFSNTFRLLAPDDRSRAGRLLQVEILPAVGETGKRGETPSGAKGHIAWNFENGALAKAPSRGIDMDGWLEQDAFLPLPPYPFRAKLRVELPGWAGIPKNRIVVKRGPAILIERTLSAGFHDLEIDSEAGDGTGDLRIYFSNTFLLPSPDGRKRAARLLRLEIAPIPQP